MCSPSSPDHHLLRDAIARNADWIRNYLEFHGYRAYATEFGDWIYERLQARVLPDTPPEELDRMVRHELRSVIEDEDRSPPFFKKSSKGSPLVENLPDPTSDTFVEELERTDYLRECLESIRKDSRELLLAAYTLTEKEVSQKEARDKLARKLGISRAALDQRLSRAREMIRTRFSSKSFKTKKGPRDDSDFKLR